MHGAQCPTGSLRLLGARLKPASDALLDSEAESRIQDLQSQGRGTSGMEADMADELMINRGARFGHKKTGVAVAPLRGSPTLWTLDLKSKGEAKFTQPRLMQIKAWPHRLIAGAGAQFILSESPLGDP